MPDASQTPILIKDLTFRYHSRVQPALSQINLTVNPGEVLLAGGSSGCGKTTLMRCINGLIPNAYSGEIEGDITLFGQSVFEMDMAEISQTVGTILQDPERQILGTYVLNDVAFGLESLGMSRDEIIHQVDQNPGTLGHSPVTRP